MSSNPEIRSESTTAPPKAGAENNASERTSALTVELSPSTASADAEGKSSVLTTPPRDFDPHSPTQTTVNTTDATIVQNRSRNQENSSSHSSRTEIFTDQNEPNDVVIIVDNELIDGYIPSRLGNYQIIQKIGYGGMGNIYLATDIFLDRKAAIKILLPKYQFTEVRERFIVEAKASAKLHHENIVTIYSYGETNDLPYFAMEYIPGSNLKTIVEKNGVLSIENTLSYAIQMASALEHINEKGIVHRDIKPSNIIITDNGTVKVIDLGLAKDFIQQQDDELTKAGVTLGTFDYISPEQSLDPRKVDIRADIYSLGCTMFFMLIGKPPFADKKHDDKIKSHRSDTTPNIRDLRPNIPAYLSEIVMRCMAKDPSMRYQTPQELSRDLFIAAEEQGMRPSIYSISKWYLPTKSQLLVWKDRLAWAIPIAALFIVVMILNCFWQPDQRQTEFLPETPSLKQIDESENSAERTAPIFGTIKKGKVLDVDSSAQAFPPTPEEPTPNESQTLQPPVAADEQPPALDDNLQPVSEPDNPTTAAASKVVQPTRKSVAAPVQKNAILPDSNPGNVSQRNASEDNTNQNEIIHSVKLETD